MNILLTGVAGFIGYHAAERLLSEGHLLTGLDNLNEYYDPSLKRSRLDRLKRHDNFTFHRLDLVESSALNRLIQEHSFERVIHLAAQAGVRYSMEHPEDYIQSNLVGFGNLLEACRQAETPHLVYASSSSVYGASNRLPFSENDCADRPMSIYAATKRANELMACSYSSLYQLKMTGLRFFTAYGPWGRPDMALFLFTRSILAGEPIEVFNNGKHQRDFTFVKDIVEGLCRVTLSEPELTDDEALHRIYNIGNGSPVEVSKMISILECALGIEAIQKNLPIQPGDIEHTWADCTAIKQDFGYEPTTSLEEGIAHFVDWYRSYYGVL